METDRFVAPDPPFLVMRWSLIDLSVWSHLAQKDGAPTCSASGGGGGGWGQERWAGLHTNRHTHTNTPWDLMISPLFKETFIELNTSFTLIHHVHRAPSPHPPPVYNPVNDDGDRRHDRAHRAPAQKRKHTRVVSVTQGLWGGSEGQAAAGRSFYELEEMRTDRDRRRK